MLIEFTKMQGAGNDFVVIDNRAGRLALGAALARRLADRRYGVGCDQVLVIERPAAPDADIGYRIFNADGSESGQCGNGIRCVARYLGDRGALEGGRLRARTGTRLLAAERDAAGGIRVDMGVPRLEPADVPLQAPARAPLYRLPGDASGPGFAALSMGNPHAVLTVEDCASAPVAELGERIQSSGLFPEGVNVSFMQVCDPELIRLRVLERGAGETPACGTGACAAVVAGRLAGTLAESVRVVLPGGELTVQWPGEGERVWMSGPAEDVFEGRIEV